MMRTARQLVGPFNRRLCLITILDRNYMKNFMIEKLTNSLKIYSYKFNEELMQSGEAVNTNFNEKQPT